MTISSCGRSRSCTSSISHGCAVVPGDYCVVGRRLVLRGAGAVPDEDVFPLVLEIDGAGVGAQVNAERKRDAVRLTSRRVVGADRAEALRLIARVASRI